MTTQSWTSPLNHSTEAGFRAWGSEISARLAAIGLVQTGDAGQINWASVALPAVNIIAGYEIWRFNDTRQGTAPIFLKLEYGTGGTTSRTIMYITVGTGSNGSGTITGPATTRTLIISAANAASTIANYPSYACAVDGMAWLINKVGWSGTPIGQACFMICRTCDLSGNPTVDGFVVYTRNTNNTSTVPFDVQAVRTIAPATAFPVTNAYYVTVIVHNVLSTADGSDTQAFIHWMPSPKVVPVFGACSMLLNEATAGVSFAATLVGSTPRTYLSVGVAMGVAGFSQSPHASLCMIYE